MSTLEPELHIVTGAFGYTGKYITERLLNQGYRVRTLTNSIYRANPFAGIVEAYPFNFDNPDRLRESLTGAKVLYNTYWIRYNCAGFKQSVAVENTLKLFEGARDAGVERVVHISIANPSEDEELEYYRSKAFLERALVESGLSYAILRPTVLFGKEDILINNIAWTLRYLPVFGVFGWGDYCIQPVYVDDLARLAVEQGQQRANLIIDATGPEKFKYSELIREIARVIGKHRLILPVPPFLGYLFSSIVGKLKGDIIITRDEIRGLMKGLLCTQSPPTGLTHLSEWARDNADILGKRYASELARRRNKIEEYKNL